MTAPKPETRESVLRDLRAVFGGGLAAALVTVLTPMLAPDVVRPDPFTGADWKEQKKALKASIENEMRLFRAEMAARLPPDATRQRIHALEEAMREVKPGFRPPTARFNHWHNGPNR